MDDSDVEWLTHVGVCAYIHIQTQCNPFSVGFMG